MKKTIQLFLLTIFAINLSHAQITDEAKEFIETNYQAGSKPFLETIYLNVRYPYEARSTCRIGKLKTRLTISNEGELAQVEFLNKLGKGLENEVTRVLQLVKAGWTTSNSNSPRTIILTFGFQIQENPVITGDISIVADGEIASCTPNETLMKKLANALDKEKIKRAKEITNELLRRDFQSDQFLEFLQQVNSYE